MRKLLVLLLMATSCTSPELEKELETNYETTISILIDNNKRAEGILKRAIATEPVKFVTWDTVHYELRKTLKEVKELYESDTNFENEYLEAYKRQSKKLNELALLIFGVDKDSEQERKRAVGFASEDQILNATLPKHFACSTLLHSSLNLFHEAISQVSYTSLYFGIPWHGQISKKDPNRRISLYSQEFPKDAYFIVNSIVDSRGNNVERFKSAPNHNVWDISLPSDSKDTAYYLSGSIFGTHPGTGEIHELDTFQKRKVSFNFPFPENQIKPLSNRN